MTVNIEMAGKFLKKKCNTKIEKISPILGFPCNKYKKIMIY